jgi:protein-S-isoprenylcysteine O-methyltransferase Ste14
MIIEQLKDFLQHRRQNITDVALFLIFSAWCGVQLYNTWVEGRLDFIEMSFGVQNIVLVFLFLIRTKHRLFNQNLFDQSVAAVAFLSGAAFLGQPETASGSALILARAIIVASNVLGIVTLLNLGRSFGVFIALREVRTTGLYSVVRHPMYLTDILLRVGYLISHFTAFIVAAFVLSTACYVYRALLEERFLSRQPEYAEYLQRVKYRFIPYVF